MSTQFTRLKLRRGTAATNPLLAEGEPGWDNDDHVLKIGDGETLFDKLPGFVALVGGDLEAIQTALDRADDAGGGKVITSYRNRSFSDTAGLTIGDNVELDGQGATWTFTALASSAKSIHANTKTAPKVRNLTIVHSAATSSNQHGVLFEDCIDFVVENVVTDGADRGLWFTNSGSTYAVNTGGRVVNCDSFNSYGYGFHFDRCSDTLVDGCNADGARSQDGFKTTDLCARMRFVGCHGSNNTRDGFDFMDGFIESTAVGCTAEDNTLEGFDIKGSAGGVGNLATNIVVRESTFEGCVARGNGDAGFHLTDLRMLAFNGCISTLNDDNGWSLSSVEGCSFTGCHGDKNSAYGWRFVQGVKKNTFTGCTANDNSFTQAGYDGWRLQTQATGSSDQNIFVGCTANRGVNRTVTDGVTTNADQTVTSATAAFTDADVGKPIRIGSWYTTIQTINSATSIEVEAAPTSTATGVTLVIGDLEKGQQDRGFHFVAGRCSGNVMIGCEAIGNVTGDVYTPTTAWAANHIVSYRDTNGWQDGTIEVTKTADEPVNNSSSVQADNELLFTLPASAHVRGEVVLFVTGDATADFKWQLLPSVTLVRGVCASHGPRTADGLVESSQVSAIGDTRTNGTSAGGGKIVISFDIVNDTTAGTITLRWAQNSAQLADTVVKAGSHIIGRRVP